MGFGSLDAEKYTDRVATRAASGGAVFDHDHKIRKGQAAKGTHPLMNPKGVIRESRDSTEHPNSTAIAIMFDVTGSMRETPVVLQNKLVSFMTILNESRYVPDPQIMFCAVGDAYSDASPLQVGQFESSEAVDDHLSRIYLEGHGGSGMSESYELAAYFLLHKTSLDCFDKRKVKGYAFIFGDELPYNEVNTRQINKLLEPDTAPISEQSDIQTKHVFDALKLKYHVFYCIPKGSANVDSQTLLTKWQGLIGKENVIVFDEQEVVNVVTSLIALTEGHSLDTVLQRLPDLSSRRSTALRNVLREYAGSVVGRVPTPTPEAAPTATRRLLR